MGTISLDDRDGAILEELDRGGATVEALARDVDCSPDYVRQRLPELADNGLVRHDGDAYALTESGARAIPASPDGTEDDRIDTPPEVERRIATFDLRADREAAVRGAVSFLRYWGDATTGEIVDAGFDERPAGAPTADAWWSDVIRDHLAALPHVEAPARGDRYWRYDDTPLVETHTGDGRVAPGDDPIAPGSARMAIELLGLSDLERAAVRVAFDRLVHAGEVTAATLEVERYLDDVDGYDPDDDWWSDLVVPAFEAIPAVEPTDDDPERWRHRRVAEGVTVSNPRADDPDGPSEPADGPAHGTDRRDGE